MFIGGVDPQFFIPPIQEVPVVREHYWEVELDELWVGDTKFCCRDDEDKTPGYVIFDSGTSFNTIPHREAKRFFNLFLKKQCLLEPLDTSGDTEESIRETLLKDYPTITYKLVSWKLVNRIGKVAFNVNTVVTSGGRREYHSNS